MAEEQRAHGPRRVHFGGASEPENRLILGDNLEATADVPSRSLAMIYVDPPFATGSSRRGGRRRDRVLSYRDQHKDPELFVAWLGPRLARARDLLAPSGSLFVHLDSRAVHYVKVHLDKLFGRNRFINEIIWCYSVGGKSRKSFGSKHDTILWYSRTANYAFYPDAVRVARKPNSHMKVVRDESGELVQEKTDRKTGKVYRYPLNRGKIPEDWWTDIETLNRGDRERTGYPTQKPERLLERIVRATTAEGDCVGDLFAGSGTTGVAAIRRGRRCFLADANPAAIEVCEQRLSDLGHELAAAGSPPPDLVVGPPTSSAMK